MKPYFYDFHLHSCLSPCADDDMTPATLAGMLKLAGIEIAALTDHNTCKNCPAFFQACQAYGITPVAGMELTTAEEIHVVCLFPTLEDALDFENAVFKYRPKIPNKPDIFGYQHVCDVDDVVIEEDPFLLSVATSIGLDDAFSLVQKYNGVCYPAHIDRESGGIVAILGTIPPTPPFRAAEFRDPSSVSSYRSKHPVPPLTFSSSDAHFISGIPDAAATIFLSGSDDQALRNCLIQTIRDGAISADEN